MNLKLLILGLQLACLAHICGAEAADTDNTNQAKNDEYVLEEVPDAQPAGPIARTYYGYDYDRRDSRDRYPRRYTDHTRTQYVNRGLLGGLLDILGLGGAAHRKKWDRRRGRWTYSNEWGSREWDNWGDDNSYERYGGDPYYSGRYDPYYYRRQVYDYYNNRNNGPRRFRRVRSNNI